MLVVPESVDLSAYFRIVDFTLDLIQQFVKTLGIEEFFELGVKYLHLALEVRVAVAAMPDLANELLTSL